MTLPAPHCLKPDTKRPKGIFPRIDMLIDRALIGAGLTNVRYAPVANKFRTAAK
jgi:hypothetical protein